MMRYQPPPQAGPPLLVDAKQAATLLAIGERTLWSLTRASEVPHVRIGRRILYPVDDLKTWVRAQTKGGQS